MSSPTSLLYETDPLGSMGDAPPRVLAPVICSNADDRVYSRRKHPVRTKYRNRQNYNWFDRKPCILSKNLFWLRFVGSAYILRKQKTETADHNRTAILCWSHRRNTINSSRFRHTRQKVGRKYTVIQRRHCIFKRFFVNSIQNWICTYPRLFYSVNEKSIYFRFTFSATTWTKILLGGGGGLIN